jgi:hypothetical protein
MADLTITASSVVPTSTTVVASGTAGATITQGQTLYADATASNQLKPAANTSVATAVVVGIALNAASAGQPVDYAVSGDLTMTVTGNLTLATCYVLGANAGGISISADLDSSTNTRYGTIVGIASAATTLKVGFIASGVKNP